MPVLAPYGGVALCQRPPRSGPIADELVPAKGSSIIIEACTLNDHNNYRRPADVWLEEVPNLLVMRGNVGMTRGFFSNATRKYHYEAVFGGGWANLSAVGVSPAIDLDGPYLAAASSGMWRGELPTGLSERGVQGHGPRLEIADDNWNYPLAFRRLPRQLQPFAGSDSDSGAAQDMEGLKRQLREELREELRAELRAEMAAMHTQLKTDDRGIALVWDVDTSIGLTLPSGILNAPASGSVNGGPGTGHGLAVNVSAAAPFSSAKSKSAAVPLDLREHGRVPRAQVF